MASRAVFTIEDVLEELDNDEEIIYESEDDFDGYLEENEMMPDDELENQNSSESPELERDVEQNSSERPEIENVAMDVDQADTSVDGNAQNVVMDVDQGDTSVDGSAHAIPQYTHQPGLANPQPDKSPLSYFSRFVTRPMLDHLVDQTKLYSQQYKESNTVTEKSRVARWMKEDLTVPKLLRFIALVLVMGFIKYPSIESHWNKSWPFTCDTFRKVCCNNIKQ